LFGPYGSIGNPEKPLTLHEQAVEFVPEPFDLDKANHILREVLIFILTKDKL